MKKRSHHKVTKGAKGHKAERDQDETLRSYFKFLVRNRSAVVLARFHNYDQAMEFAGLMLARCASANSMLPSGAVSVEWHDDEGRRHVESMTLTIEREEVSG